MQQPNALAKVQLLSTKGQLDSGHVYEKQPVIIDAVAKFNDRSLNSGGLMFSHDLFLGIDPEAVTPGTLTPKHAWDMLLEVKKEYANTKANFHRSGQNSSDFASFCQGKPDILYFHFWINHLKLPELTTFASCGSIISEGFDTSSFESPSRGSTESVKPRSSEKHLKRLIEIKEKESNAKESLVRFKKMKLLLELDEKLDASISNILHQSSQDPSSARLTQLQATHKEVMKQLEEETNKEKEDNR